MKDIIFRGSATAIVTPFDKEGRIDYTSFKKLIDFQIENKTDAVVVCGTTGESPTLTREESLELIECAVKYVNKRIPIIAGSGSNDTKKTVDMSKEVEKLGVDGLLILTPYYNKTSQSGLYEHYKAVSGSVSKPIILYNVPSRTGMSITAQTYKKLCEIDNIVAAKEASGNLSLVAQIRALCKDNLNIYSGVDDQIVPTLSLGGIGVISVASNIIPKVVHDICDFYLSGDVDQSRDLQLEYLDLINCLFLDVNPIPVKYALNLMGYQVGGCRGPLYEIDEIPREALSKALKEYKIV